MAHFQSLLDTPTFVPSEDDLALADYELYPSEIEIDPYTRNRTSHLRQQLSWIEDSAKGYYFQSPYTTSTPNNTSDPFSAYNAAGYLSGNSGMNLLPTGSSIAYSHSDRFPSPWTGHPSSPSGLDSPRSSSWENNIGCYMSPPFTKDDVMIPSVEDCRYPSPGALVALPEVQIQPDHESVVDMHMGTQGFPLDGVDDTNHGLGLDHQVPPVSGGMQAIDQDLDQPSKPSSPSRNPKIDRLSTDRVRKPSRRPTRQRPTRTTPPKTSAPTPVRTKQKNKPKVTHGRQFVCSFAHYGCTSTFGSKNEWKRHVTSQHLQLGSYRCDIADCNINRKSSKDHRHHHKKSRSSSSSSSSHHGTHNADLLANDFNRKDLFTQHLRRMHAPWHTENRTSPSTEEHETFEKSLGPIRDRCWVPRRQPPAVSQCGFCGQDFHGEHSWDDRMEHVGRHFERDDPQPGAEAEDIQLRKWAVDEGIVRFFGGKWMLTSLCDERLFAP